MKITMKLHQLHTTPIHICTAVIFFYRRQGHDLLYQSPISKFVCVYFVFRRHPKHIVLYRAIPMPQLGRSRFRQGCVLYFWPFANLPVLSQMHLLLHHREHDLIFSLLFWFLLGGPGLIAKFGWVCISSASLCHMMLINLSTFFLPSSQVCLLSPCLDQIV